MKGKKMKSLKYTMVFVMYASVCFAQPNTDLLNETISRIQAKTQIGISFVEYRNEIQNLQHEFNKYKRDADKWLDQDPSDELREKEFFKYLSYDMIMIRHRCALTTWDYKFAVQDDWMPIESAGEFWTELIKNHPQFDVKKNKKQIKGKKYVKIEAVIQMFWLDIDGEIKRLGM